ncbi:unnamed protein product [Urochloa decumbens]|uniref:Phorbol-ester/DAG-type domain-containing protein n=1 Tax=Urochloa decumbens TaxID=240449 RepID=A0ABC9G1R3_9POAL
MASGHRRHFTDPHMLFKEQYNGTSSHACGICGHTLAGLVGYRCNACSFDVHGTCADNFGQSVSFFAHRLSRIRGGATRSHCDLCTEECPPGSFAYRCTRCLFDVHPHCTTLPEMARSPLCAKHELRLLPSCKRSRCLSCREDLPEWHYYCPCLVRLHVACAAGGCPDGARSGAGEAQDPAARHVTSAAVTKFLLKTGWRVVIHALTGGLTAPLQHLLD